MASTELRGLPRRHCAATRCRATGRRTCTSLSLSHGARSDDIVAGRIPMNGGAAAMGRDGHLDGDGGAEAEVERRVGPAAAAHAIEEILHVQGGDVLVGLVARLGGHGGAFSVALFSLRGVYNL